MSFRRKFADEPSAATPDGFHGNKKMRLTLPAISSLTRHCVAATLAAGLATVAGAIAMPVPGDLDPAFALGTGKIANLAISAASDSVSAVAIQPDGKIVLAGKCYNGSNNDFCVARLNADGTLDASFTGPAGIYAGKFLLPVGAEDDVVAAIVLQPDGKIILAGYCGNGVNADFCVARLNSNGSRDASFGGPGGAGNGAFPLSIGFSNDIGTSVALQPDGKILLGGYCDNGSNFDFCAARLNADGSFDASFVGPGGNGNGRFLLPIGATQDYATALLLQPDGRIVLSGYCIGAMNDQDFCVARLNADGSLDAAFDGPTGVGNGKFLLPVGTSGDYAYAAMLQPDGNIVIAGSCINGATYDFCATRLLGATGAFDQSFVGPAGNGNGKFMLPIGTFSDVANAIAQQPDGKIVLAGYCYSATGADFCVARLNGDGSFDSTFDGPANTGNGKFLVPIGTLDDFANAMTIQPDGKIVVAGYCGNGSNDDFCVARLNGGPFGYKSCSMDIDGDGKVQATTDALLITRAMLGMSGNAVVAGAVGVGASRTTWAQIRAYLTTQCGMTLAQ